MSDLSYTIEERVQIIKWYYIGGKSAASTRNQFCTSFKTRPIPTQTHIHKIVRTFKKFGCVLPCKENLSNLPPSFDKLDDAMVCSLVEEDPTMSLVEICKETKLSRKNVLSILALHKYRLYKCGPKLKTKKSAGQPIQFWVNTFDDSVLSQPKLN